MARWTASSSLTNGKEGAGGGGKGGNVEGRSEKTNKYQVIRVERLMRRVVGKVVRELDVIGYVVLPH